MQLMRKDTTKDMTEDMKGPRERTPDLERLEKQKVCILGFQVQPGPYLLKKTSVNMCV